MLAPTRLVVPLEARTLQEAESLLLEPLAAAHGVLDVVKLRRRVAERRAEDAVAMGNRAFLLHYRTDAVGQLVVALGVAPDRICRQASDEQEQCARIVIMIAAPPRHAARYLQVVGGFARLLRKPEVLEAVLAARDPDALAALDQFSEYRLPEQLAVRDVMSDHPLTVTPDVPLKDVARLLVRTGLGALPVVDEDQRVIGMVSEREVIRFLLHVQAFTGPDARVASPLALGIRTARDVMSRQVLCVAPEQPIAEVASLMSNKDVDRVPVVREGRLVGFLTRGDIVRKLIGT
ncbi:MAG: CBS domain-containing protein [Gemmatimonadaceae bacterium]|nr:CBS domain-containing protein [Gemmatimonadaceae bacterium]